ncbi:unnamed protein product [Bursaphelenchus okinawaensis]|uniref:Secreted protein n=1 Tax=Bursaphelenchus okinawaensis TaxID=465554 RepID=A0A811K2X3_9BILA|nr:unnamed protein product [Bursaphelenchus okinawaensis]CAG9090148.1 unnamed protein product [Bursaphelenchus okinawaensis]
MKLLVALCLVGVVAARDKELINVFKYLLGGANVNASDDATSTIHSKMLQYKIDAVELGGKYKIYDSSVSKLLSETNDAIEAIPLNASAPGASLAVAIAKYNRLHAALAAVATSEEMFFLDFSLKLLESMSVLGQYQHRVDLIVGSLRAGNEPVAPAQIRPIFVNMVLEAYQIAAKNKKLNPTAVLNATAVALDNIDASHPLGTGLRLYIQSLRALESAIYTQQNEVYIGHVVLKKLIDALQRAKNRQDDYLLDGLRGEALSIYERIVENLKDLKEEIRN